MTVEAASDSSERVEEPRLQIAGSSPTLTGTKSNWLELLGAIGRSSSIAHLVPALKALEFYRLIDDPPVLTMDNGLTTRSGKRVVTMTVEIDRKTFVIPQIIRARIPLTGGTIDVQGEPTLKEDWRGVNRCRFRTPTPPPKPGISAKIKAASEFFHGFEVWWAPKHVTKIEEPKDPLVVGFVQHSGKPEAQELSDPAECLYFEIDRWLDEIVEDGWYAFTAY